MKKYLFLSTLESSEWGGSEQLWSDMALLLLEKGHKVMTNTLAWPQQHDCLAKIQAKGGQLTFRPNPHIPNSISESMQNKLQALKWKIDVMDYMPDIVFISQGGTFDNIIVQHGEWIRSLGKPYHILCQFMREFDHMDKGRRSFFIDFFAGAQQVMFVSNRNKEVAERTLAAKIPNGVVVKNPIKLKQTTTGYPATDVYNIGVVARLEVAIKGYDSVISTFSYPQWADRNYHVNVYGSGIDEEYIRELVSFYGLQNRITFHGHVSDVVGVWEKNHILLLTSRGEGTPLSLLEAFYCKRAAVVTDVGGNADVVTDGVNGYVAPGPALRAVTEVMERAWQQRDQWQQQGLAAKTTIDALYKTDAVADAVQLIL